MFLTSVVLMNKCKLCTVTHQAPNWQTTPYVKSLLFFLCTALNLKNIYKKKQKQTKNIK